MGCSSQVTDIIKRIRNALSDNFHSYPWMDETTADRARDKAQAVGMFPILFSTI